MAFFALAGCGLLNTALKALFARPRPTFADPLAVAAGWSFPSGHSMGTFVAFGMLSYLGLLLLRTLRARLALVALALGWTVAMGFSRMYLGVHYLSDVLAGSPRTPCGWPPASPGSRSRGAGRVGSTASRRRDGQSRPARGGQSLAAWAAPAPAGPRRARADAGRPALRSRGRRREMQISGRNKIHGRITELVVGDVMAKVVMEGPGGTELVTVITSDAAKELGLAVGKEVQALIKATEIMVISE